MVESEVEDTISVPIEYYKRLIDDSNMLSFLEEHGVDNWEWYGEALEDFVKYKEKDQIVPNE